MKKMVLLMFLCLMLGMAGRCMAEGDVSVEFSQANKLYSQGNYEKALEIYKGIEASLDAPSMALYYNMGNAFYKLEKYPEAYACYLKAQKIAPRDKDLRQNISILRKTRIKAPDPGLLKGAAISLALYEWVLLCVLFFWGGVLSAWFLKGHTIGPVLQFFAVLFFVCSIFFALIRYDIDVRRPLAVALPGASLFAGPTAHEKVVLSPKLPIECRVLAERGEWIKVYLPTEGLTAWAQKESLVRV